MSFLNYNTPIQWNRTNAFVLRFLLIYFFIQAIPVDYKFYTDLLAISGGEQGFYILFKIANYNPQFFGLSGYQNWLIAAIIALIGALAANRFYPNSNCNFDKLYY